MKHFMASSLFSNLDNFETNLFYIYTLVYIILINMKKCIDFDVSKIVVGLGLVMAAVFSM